MGVISISLEETKQTCLPGNFFALVNSLTYIEHKLTCPENYKE